MILIIDNIDNGWVQSPLATTQRPPSLQLLCWWGCALCMQVPGTGGSLLTVALFSAYPASPPDALEKVPGQQLRKLPCPCVMHRGLGMDLLTLLVALSLGLALLLQPCPVLASDPDRCSGLTCWAGGPAQLPWACGPPFCLSGPLLATLSAVCARCPPGSSAHLPLLVRPWAPPVAAGCLPGWGTGLSQAQLRPTDPCGQLGSPLVGTLARGRRRSSLWKGQVGGSP